MNKSSVQDFMNVLFFGIFLILIEIILILYAGVDTEYLPGLFCCCFIFPKLHEKKRVAFKNSPQVRYYRDTYAEHPEDRKNIEYTVHLDRDEDLVTLSGVYEQLKHIDESFKLDYAR